jgi:hypothetical protein
MSRIIAAAVLARVQKRRCTECLRSRGFDDPPTSFRLAMP